MIKKLLDSRLSKAGYEIMVVSDGREAQEKIRRFDPDVILSDIVMPGVNGYELHKRLRKNPTPPTFLIPLFPKQTSTTDRAS